MGLNSVVGGGRGDGGSESGGLLEVGDRVLRLLAFYAKDRPVSAINVVFVQALSRNVPVIPALTASYQTRANFLCMAQAQTIVALHRQRGNFRFRKD